MREVTMEDVKSCIRQFGLYGLTTSELRQVIREAALKGDTSSHILQTAALQVLVSKLKQDLKTDVSPKTASASETVLAEYTRLHEELAEMLLSGRIPRTQIKDDYLWLVDALERINAARRAAGITAISAVL